MLVRRKGSKEGLELNDLKEWFKGIVRRNGSKEWFEGRVQKKGPEQLFCSIFLKLSNIKYLS